jgi:DNA-binding FadR family transcriptional regulator
MLTQHPEFQNLSEFMRFLALHETAEDGLPALKKLSEELNISVPTLREQLEVARALGFVDVRPRRGTHRLPYSFLPAVRQSLGYALLLDQKNFALFSDLRKHVEAAYWFEAVEKLTSEDQKELHALVAGAQDKLNGTPIHLPHQEHRQLHLLIFKRLDNPFVQGILEAYWDAYESVGLNVYTDYQYLQEVWEYHAKMVESICSGNLEAGYQLLLDHVDLIYHRPTSLMNG